VSREDSVCNSQHFAMTKVRIFCFGHSAQTPGSMLFHVDKIVGPAKTTLSQTCSRGSDALALLSFSMEPEIMPDLMY